MIVMLSPGSKAAKLMFSLGEEGKETETETAIFLRMI